MIPAMPELLHKALTYAIPSVHSGQALKRYMKKP